MTIKELLEDMPCKVTGPVDTPVTGIVYDSRMVKPGCVFVCLVGSKTDSHVYAAQAAEGGAAAVVTQHDIAPVSCTEIRVEDTRKALALLSAAWFGHPAEKLKVIGVTGTKGKTTSTYMIHSILEAAGITTGIIGTIGTVIGSQLIKTNNTTPESYDIQKFMRMMVDAGCRACVLEASSIGLRDHRVDGFTFDIGLFTNFSEDHIGGLEHKDMAEYMACKAMLFQKCRLGVINIDDENWKGITAGHTCELTSYGFGSEAKLHAENPELVSQPGYLGIAFDLCGSMQGRVRIDISGKFNVYNALGAVAVCQQFGVALDNVRKGLDTVKVKGRVEPVEVPGGYTLLIDYAHNAVSMENILTTLREYHPNRLICMFGAGGNRPKLRRYEMGEVSGKLADLSVITADNSRYEDVMDILADIEVGLKKTTGKYIVVPDRKQAIKYCIDNAQKGDVVVLAGKGHEDYQEIKGVKYPFDERDVIHDILQEEGKLPAEY
ncbi:UDP-N-acetylmuramoyl-L-alanyl-D-glutamate--2,6-diaminopimelate ligase [Caproicibacterium lactatifermentans]|uniref:UDP-N-acetylmuramyl-tripeptide synthetase n=1 Tax=Caproicibacterium lactatifermentans TaxID=2666138 RepID=A0ABX6PX52_9FIRM|nr:UDP-N-acetylmuramoyl-L-alanyl-D-glutamate--2,6-diaminopimelate ligase [Caproicibacterium lactatifermentans]QKO30902.1 UDP-N-acetylmuramoyl-L-alanyl-D-glutamate--2,6-diaminopimelate ligase [Caproicibacterium lactatifermentans]